MSSSHTEAAPSPEAAAVEITMPQMGVSVAEGTIVEWLKQPGDSIEADEPVCVATTDKVDVEIPAPAAGRLTEVLVEPEETVAVGTLLARMDTAPSAGDVHPDESAREVHSEQSARGAHPDGSGAPAIPSQPNGDPRATSDPEAPEDAEPDRSGFHSPVVMRMAAKHGIDLTRIQGTGIGGRVRKRDLLAHLEKAGGTADERTRESTERPLHTESPYVAEADSGAPAEVAARPAGAAANGHAGAGAAPAQREPMSQMRRSIAEHMRRSLDTSAHCTTVVEVDLSAVVAARNALRERMATRGTNLTYLAFVAQATVEALQRHPGLNASIEGDEILHHADVNLGIAVALQPGLIVPVVHRAQRLSLEGLAGEIGELAERARGGDLEPDDVRGGTFTITNPGRFGAVLATPIINQPQVAILDLEAVVKRPVVIERDGSEAIAIRPMTNLCMSWDHRCLDGVDAARFLGDVKMRLEDWEVES